MTALVIVVLLAWIAAGLPVALVLGPMIAARDEQVVIPPIGGRRPVPMRLSRQG